MFVWSWNRFLRKTELQGQRARCMKHDDIFQGMENWFVWIELKVQIMTRNSSRF